MKVAVLYPETQFLPWSLTIGLANALRRQGHIVQIGPVRYQSNKVAMPDLSLLRKQDAIVLSGFERFWQLVAGSYGKGGWAKVSALKVAWYWEGAFQDDRQIIDADTIAWADEHYFPAAQDADFFDQEHLAQGRSHWLPGAVDKSVFFYNAQADRSFDVAFMGSLYPKRTLFLHKVAKHFQATQIMDCGQTEVRDLNGFQHRSSVELYAINLRDIKVFCNLPANSAMHPLKVFEAMACGAFVLTPAVEGAGKENMRLFTHKEHLLYYSETNAPYVAQLLRDWSSEEKAAERLKISMAGSELVHREHTLEKRLPILLASLDKRECASQEVVA